MTDGPIQIPDSRTLRDAKVQNELVRRLRSASDEQKREIVDGLLVVDLPVALAIARRIIHSPDHRKAIVLHGMNTANRSTIRDYLEFGQATMGLAATLAIVRSS